MTDTDTTTGSESTVFDGCPDCGGRMEYMSRSDLICQDCDEEYCHENRGGRHLLWSFTPDYDMDKIVARAGFPEEA